MFKGRHFDKSVILSCVRWYLAYNLSLRNLKEMMAESGINVDHSTVHRWVVYFSPKLLERFIHKALSRHGRPERITIDGSQTNRMAIIQCDTESSLREADAKAGTLISIRSSKYMNNTIEQGHRRIKRRIRSMLGCKSETSANITLAGIEFVHMMRKQQGIFTSTKVLSLKAQFAALTA